MYNISLLHKCIFIAFLKIFREKMYGPSLVTGHIDESNMNCQNACCFKLIRTILPVGQGADHWGGPHSHAGAQMPEACPLQYVASRAITPTSPFVCQNGKMGRKIACGGHFKTRKMCHFHTCHFDSHSVSSNSVTCQTAREAVKSAQL